jgi:hypothetical protein
VSHGRDSDEVRRTGMSEKYDLEKMLKEIKEDQTPDQGGEKARISQDEIQKMLMEKRRRKQAADS